MILTHRDINDAGIIEDDKNTLFQLEPDISMDPTLRVLNSTRGRRPVKMNSDVFDRRQTTPVGVGLYATG